MLLLIAALMPMVQTRAAERLDRDPPRVTLNEQNNLASLMDLCARRLSLNIEYPEAELRRTAVTLRLGEGVTDEELWMLSNRLLAAHGWTSIRMHGDRVLSVVKLADASRQTEFGTALDSEKPAGFTSVVRRVEHMDPRSVLNIAKPLLSQPAGNIARLGDTDFILISDLQPRLNEILSLIDALDRPDAIPDILVEPMTLKFADASHIVAQVTAAVASRDAIAARPLPGRIAAGLSGDTVVIVAPREAMDAWRSMIDRLDRREPVETRIYQPGPFQMADVARLIEQSARTDGSGSGDRWRLIEDALTDTLIITATTREHTSIESLFDRLNNSGDAPRSMMRTLIVRNRSVSDVLRVLEQLIEGDALAAHGSSGSHATARMTSLDGDNRSPTGASPMDDSRLPVRESDIVPISKSVSLFLTADEQSNALIAVGEPRMLAQLESLLRSLDVRQPQVELEVFVINLSESDARDLGIELQKLEVSGSTLIGLSSLFGLSDLRIDAASPLIGGRGFSGVVLSPGDFSIVIRALRTVNEGAARSYPRLLVNNNEQAMLNAVVQQPFSSINATQTVATTSFAGTLDAGTQVSVTPQIAAGDHLVLQYSIALSTFVGESSDPALPPPRQQTSIQSVVTIPDGYTIAVGGLETMSEAAAISQIPLLGEIPGLGELFRTRSRSNSRSRFYVFIRASVLRHNGFEDLKYLSDRQKISVEVDDDWPVLEPRVIR